ncbi:unnamed protein product [Rhizophagus irregularis]|nr:unnamed protein product [Rhizophagus irregularis]
MILINNKVRARIRADIKQTNPVILSVHKIVVPDIFQRFHMNPNISLYRKSKETVDNVKSYTLKFNSDTDCLIISSCTPMII